MRLGLTPRGTGFAVAGLLLLLAAWLGRVPEVRWVGFLLLAFPLTSLLLAWRGPRVRLSRRTLPAMVRVGSVMSVDAVATVTREGLGIDHVVDEELPAVLGGGHRFSLRALGAQEATFESYTRRPRRRGRWPLGAAWLESTDPLGLARSRRLLDDGRLVSVSPVVFPLDGGVVGPAGFNGETPLPQISTAGPDDVVVREYVPGDDVRRVHWPATARTGELMVRREELAWDPTAWVVLDNRSGVHPTQGGVSASFEWLVSLAASVGVRLAAEGFDVSLADTTGRTFSPHNVGGTHVAQAWVENLIDASPAADGNISQAVAHATRTPGGVIVALLGRLDAAAAAELVASETRHQCLALVVPPAANPLAAQQHSDGLRILRANRWSVAVVGVGGNPADAWASLGRVHA